MTVSLIEGKNREIRHVMKNFGWNVSRLIRISYGPFQLGGLKKGDVDEVREKVLKQQLGVQDCLGFAAKTKKKITSMNKESQSAFDDSNNKTNTQNGFDEI